MQIKRKTAAAGATMSNYCELGFSSEKKIKGSLLSNHHEVNFFCLVDRITIKLFHLFSGDNDNIKFDWTVRVVSWASGRLDQFS